LREHAFRRGGTDRRGRKHDRHWDHRQRRQLDGPRRQRLRVLLVELRRALEQFLRRVDVRVVRVVRLVG
jgi:hypothetical protein